MTLAPAEVPEAIRTAQCANNLSHMAILRAEVWPEDAILDQQVSVQIYTKGCLHAHLDTAGTCYDCGKVLATLASPAEKGRTP